LYGTWRRDLLRMAPIVALGLVGILVAAPSASGQAAVDQYVPTGNPAGASGGASGSLRPLGPGESAPGSGHAVAADPGNGSANGGDLPFSGYPVTSFVWIVLAVLLVGALVRVAASMLRRRGARGTA
jgi:hypothetical protein